MILREYESAYGLLESAALAFAVYGTSSPQATYGSLNLYLQLVINNYQSKQISL
jgi:hypothetical protein